MLFLRRLQDMSDGSVFWIVYREDAPESPVVVFDNADMTGLVREYHRLREEKL